MRDLVILAATVWLAFSALKRPWIGILGWTWLSLMNPHRLAYGFAVTMPVAAIVGGATLVGLFVTKDRREFNLTAESGFLIALMAWMCVTLPFSMIFDPSFEMWKRVMKIDMMVLVTIALLHSEKQIKAFIWVVTGSLAFYGIKGGIFTIAKGGSHKVWGPEDSFIEGNNEIALALIMIIPLMHFLRGSTDNVWLKRGLLAGMILCTMAALGSHSRGALLALIAMAAVLWSRSERKFVTAVILVGVAALAIPFMPEEWMSRMNTIKSYEKDDSAMGRINAWWMAWNLASQNLFGGGYFIWTLSIFEKYAPVRDDVHAAHSIYFQMLGEHGFIGLFLFLGIWVFAWIKAGRLRKIAAGKPDTLWVARLGAMCQVSLAGYAVGGAFLSLSYFDLPYNVMIMVVVAHRWLVRGEWQHQSLSQGVMPVASKQGVVA